MSKMTIDEAICQLEDLRRDSEDFADIFVQDMNAIDVAIEHLRSLPRWIPCSEKMPEKYTAVLVFDNFGDMWTGQVDKNGMWCEADDYDYIVYDNICNVTHWMPLPEPPEMEEQA